MKRDTETLLRCALDTYEYWGSLDTHGAWFNWAIGLHKYRKQLAAGSIMADLDWANYEDQARENARRAMATCESRIAAAHSLAGAHTNAVSWAVAKLALDTCDAVATERANGESEANAEREGETMTERNAHVAQPIRDIINRASEAEYDAVMAEL